MTSMPAIRKVQVQTYVTASDPRRLAVGDVIRCVDFQLGLRCAADPDLVVVGWQDGSYPDYRASTGRGQLAHDPSRATAPFLVSSVSFVEGEGPDDVLPGNHRLSLDVRWLRLTDDYCLVADPEKVRFSLHEPMSVAQPPVSRIKLLGYAELPISWDEES